MNSTIETPTNNSSNEFKYLSQGRDVPSFIISLTFGSLLFTLIRFHDFSGMTVLGSIRFPLIMSLIVAGVSLRFLSNAWPKQLKLFFAIIILEGIRGFIGYIVFPNFVVNDGWQFHTWMDLVFHFFSFMLAVVFAFSSGLRLRKMISFLVFAGFMLALWAITHSGHGPGGYIGDENDNCLVLVSLIPFTFLLSITGASKGKIIFGYITAFLLVLGVVSTQSRGGFLGFVSVLTFQFLYSPRKLRWIMGACILGLCSLPFVPEKYYKEMKSIKTDASSGKGTMQERYDTWFFIYKMWKDPKNIVTGVGLENSKWRLHEYEDSTRGITEKSLAGRASHSMYFQLLGDMGSWGILVIGTIVLSTLRNLRRILKETKKTNRKIAELVFNYGKSNAETDQGKDLKIQTISDISKEFNFIQGVARALLSSWFGVLAAALGISVLYYPTIWFLTALSAALLLYYQKLSRVLFKLMAGI